MEWIGAAACVGAVWLLSFEFTNAGTFDKSRKGLKVVITGGTRGLGLELAKSFLECEDDVLVASRSAESCASAEAELRVAYPKRTVRALACDVAKLADVENVAREAVQAMGRIDIWINNAAVSNSVKQPLAESDAQEYYAIVGCNLVGAMHGAAAAMRVMARQSPPGGKIFFVDGAGSRGGGTPNNAAYGATKHALVQLKKSLTKETQGTVTSVHMYSPGMVATDLLLLPNLGNARSMRVLNVLAEDPAVVARWLVPRLRGVKTPGTYIKFLTPLGVLWRFLTARSRKGRFDHYSKQR